MIRMIATDDARERSIRQEEAEVERHRHWALELFAAVAGGVLFAAMLAVIVWCIDSHVVPPQYVKPFVECALIVAVCCFRIAYEAWRA